MRRHKQTKNQMRVGLSREKLAGVPQILDEVHRLAQLQLDGGEGQPNRIDPLLEEANGYHLDAARREIRRRCEARSGRLVAAAAGDDDGEDEEEDDDGQA